MPKFWQSGVSSDRIFHSAPLLFSRRWLSFYAVVLCLSALLLLELDYYIPSFSNWVNRYAGLLVTPVQYLADFPVQSFYQLRRHFVSSNALLSENTKLRAQLQLLRSQLNQMVAAENDRKKLMENLNVPERVGLGKTLPARLLWIRLDPTYQSMLINKGSYQGVYLGQPVIDGQGIIGQIKKLSVFNSQVLLITDPTSGIPVQVQRNGLRAIAVGRGPKGLALLHIPDTWDVQLGDRLVTSGLGHRYPAGYPVGYISDIKRPVNERFAQVTVQPFAQMHRGTAVLLTWPVLIKGKRHRLGKPLTHLRQPNRSFQPSLS